MPAPGVSESGPTPFVVFDGNCQGQHLAAVFDAAGLAETWVSGRDFGTVPSFRGRLARFSDENGCAQMMAHARSQGRLCIQATQSTPWSDATVTEYTGIAHRVVRYPYLHCNVYLRASGDGGVRTSLKRVYEADLDVIRLCQGYAGSGFDFAGFIDAEQVRRPLFHMHVHPGGALMGELVRDLGLRSEAFPAETIEALAREMAAGEGINVFSQHPLSVEARAMLGFDWAQDYATYAEMIETARRGDSAGFLARAGIWESSFGHETQYWSGLFLSAIDLRRDDLVWTAFERLVRLSPGYPDFWRLAYSYSDASARVVLRDRMLSVYVAQRQAHNLRAYMASLDGRHDEAEAHASLFQHHASDLNDGFVPLMLARVAAGRIDEARAGSYAFAMAQTIERRDEIGAVMRTYPLLQDMVLPEA